MNKREAKKIACQFAADVLNKVDEEPFLSENFSESETRKIKEALHELQDELWRRAGA